MRRKVARRRLITIAATYVAVGLGVFGTLVAAKRLGLSDFGTLALVLAATAFVQSLLDLTVEGTAVKYGCRYTERGEWGRLRRLFRRALQIKIVGACLAGGCLAGIAPFAPRFIEASSILTLLLLAALIPLAQGPESVGGAALLVKGRHDLRALLLAGGGGLRLLALVVGSGFGVTGALAGLVLAHAVASVVALLAGRRALRTFPAAAERDLRDDARELTAFTIQTSFTTGVLSVRTALMPLLLGTPAQVGLFRAAQAAEQGFEALSMPARMVLLAEQTRHWEAGAHDVVLRSVVRFMVWTTAAMAVVVPLMVVFSPALVRLAYGDDFGAAVPVLQLFIVAGAIQFIFSWTNPFSVVVGRPTLQLLVRCVEAVVLLVLAVVFGAAAGAVGAAAAVMVATVGYAACWTTIFFRFRDRREAPASARRVRLAW